MPVHFGGGGSNRNLEVLKRLKERLDIAFVPSIFGNLIHAIESPYYSRSLLSMIDGLDLDTPDPIREMLKSVATSRPTLGPFKGFALITKVARLLNRYSFELAYSMSEIPHDVLLAALVPSRKRAFLMQGLWYTTDVVHDFLLEVSTKYYKAYSLSTYARVLQRSVIRNFTYLISRKFDAIFSINPELLNMTGLDRVVKDRGKIKVIRPGNATSVDAMRAPSHKQDYVVHFGRLHPTKGLFLVPHVMRRIKHKGKEVKLVLFGKFADERVKKKFFSLVNRLGMADSVEYKGLLGQSHMYDVISRAKAFLFPTLVDVHPLSVLDSIALGTAVVTRRLPTLEYLYQGLPSVALCDDIFSMAEQLEKFIDTDPEEYKAMFSDGKVVEFLREHSSWDKVAEAEHKAIIELMSRLK
ncbi:MAG: glycosyltransferase [Thermoprotei archaeon]